VTGKKVDLHVGAVSDHGGGHPLSTRKTIFHAEGYIIDLTIAVKETSNKCPDSDRANVGLIPKSKLRSGIRRPNGCKGGQLEGIPKMTEAEPSCAKLSTYI